MDSTVGPAADSPTFQVTGGPADGTVTIAPDATFTYSSSTVAPDTAPTDLPDNFTVTVSDPRGDATTVQVSVAPDPAAGAGTSLVLTGSDGAADEVHVALSPTDSDEAGRLVVHSSTYPADAASELTVESIAVGRNPQQVAAHPVLPLVYVANQVDKTVTVVDRTTGSVVATIPVGGSATAVAVTPDGTRAYVTLKSFLGKVAVIDTATNTVVTTVRVGSHPTGLAVSPDGARLYVANKNGHSVSVIDTATNKAVDANPSLFATRIRVGAYPSALALSADGTRLYVANTGSNSVSVVNTTTYRTVDANPSFFSTRVRVGSSPSALAVAPDGCQVYVANTAGDTVSVIDVDAAAGTYRVVDTDPNAAGTQSIFVGCSPTSVAVSPDGSRVYAALSSDMVAVIDTASHRVSLTQIDTAPESGAHTLALGPDGQVYVIDAVDQTLRSMPAVDGVVTMGRSALVLPDTDGFTVEATWYFPNRADGPVGLIYLQHGAWRSDIYVSALAQHLADRTNSIVVTPTFASEVLARYNVAGTRVAEAVTALFAGDRAELAASAAAAAGRAVPLPQQFVLAGHSAGGKLVAVAAGYLTDAGAAGDLKGVVMFDPFSDGDATAGLAKLTGAHAVPVAMISAAPCAWNDWGDNTVEIIDAAPDSFVAIRLDGGSHIDAEGASSDALGMVGCGVSLPQNAAALQTITAGWITDFFAGSHDGIYGPQGTPVAVSGATGTVIAAKG
ncbi:beta-propeller fold lactonase family protein [Mycolicibacterium duvalii]|uniref:beta-propeller fold lactonase family protein n=1 Tax=Mycolicibacterium duvalii TaxID=39688 RepID=UPI0010554D2E|nr:beta-propeller fold lactonase family protein [Mycolicibacterium duvalii]MCV7370357.1 beta-propeller fold lactonase family protein [Mycolicibacterium duvalii]